MIKNGFDFNNPQNNEKMFCDNTSANTFSQREINH